RVAGAGEPERDARVHDLVRRRVPPVAHDELARARELAVEAEGGEWKRHIAIGGPRRLQKRSAPRGRALIVAGAARVTCWRTSSGCSSWTRPWLPALPCSCSTWPSSFSWSAACAPCAPDGSSRSA